MSDSLENNFYQLKDFRNVNLYSSKVLITIKIEDYFQNVPAVSPPKITIKLTTVKTFIQIKYSRVRVNRNPNR